MKTVSLFEGAQLELAGAERRLALAIQALRDFDLEFADKVAGDELARSLAHERESLCCELDAAKRRHAECHAQAEEMKQGVNEK
jgi:hypothetical protein